MTGKPLPEQIKPAVPVEQAGRANPAFRHRPVHVIRRLAELAGTARDSLGDQLRAEHEQRRTFLWYPVFLSIGILIYFSLPREPLLPALLLVSALPLVMAAMRFRGAQPVQVWIVLALISVGALTAKIRTDSLASRLTGGPVFASVSGVVSAVQVRAGRSPRIVLSAPQIESRRPVKAPDKVRISLLKSADLPPIGAAILIRARIGPVPGPSVPGGYDPQRAAYFDGIGASGFAVGHWSLLPDEEFPVAQGIDVRIQATRQALVRRILDNQPGTAGAVAAALLVGERGYLPEKTVQDLRDAGLAHILAISGLHMALFAGSVFLIVRALLALSMPLALRRPIKKWAAVAALAAGFCYLLLSGGNVATLRAFIMAAIMFCAVLVDRPALSLRNLAIAALVILLMQPESVAEPGFQMSFAAVTALIAFYETWRDRPKLNLAEPPATRTGLIFLRGRRYVGGIAMTTIVAGLATGPIAAFHFNHVAVYSLLGNLLAMPIVALIVMPAGLLSLILMPFGLESLPLAIMAYGTTTIVDIAATVSARDGASLIVPSSSPVTLAVFMAGFLWLCLWRLRWRWLGLVGLIAAPVMLPLEPPRPDILVSPRGTSVAVRDASGALRIGTRRKNQYVLEQWFRREGEPVPPQDDLERSVVCDPAACLLKLADGSSVAHVYDHAAFPEECAVADVIVTSLIAPGNCQAALVIDKQRLDRFGAHAATLHTGADFAVTTAYSPLRRPWQGQPLP